MYTQLVILAQHQFMSDRIFKITFDIHIRFLARDHPAYCANFKQHPLKIKQIVIAKNSLAVTGENAVQISHRKFMSQLGQAAPACLIRCGIDQFESHEDLTHNELLHLPDTTNDPFLFNGERIRSAVGRKILKNGIQQHQKMSWQQLGVPQNIRHGIFLKPSLIGNSLRENGLKEF